MKRYRSLYAYQVFDAVKEGKEVCVLNRDTLSVIRVTNLSITDFLSYIKAAESAESDKGDGYYNVSKYEFWYEYDEQEEEDNDAV